MPCQPAKSDARLQSLPCTERRSEKTMDTTLISYLPRMNRHGLDGIVCDANGGRFLCATAGLTNLNRGPRQAATLPLTNSRPARARAAAWGAWPHARTRARHVRRKATKAVRAGPAFLQLAAGSDKKLCCGGGACPVNPNGSCVRFHGRDTKNVRFEWRTSLRSARCFLDPPMAGGW